MKDRKLLRGIAKAKVALLRAINLKIMWKPQSAANVQSAVFRTEFLSFSRISSVPTRHRIQSNSRCYFMACRVSMFMRMRKRKSAAQGRIRSCLWSSFHRKVAAASDRASLLDWGNKASFSKRFIHTTALRGYWRAIVRDRME
jgi:hypothetical protein